MPVSAALYQSDIPFVNIQKIKLFYNAEGETIVSLDISNEILGPLAGNATEFGNFVYLSELRAPLEHLAAYPDKLKSLIMGTKSGTSKINNYYFSLTRQDFRLKTEDSSEPAKPIYNNVYTQTSTLKDTKGGNAMTGLIADAHIEKVAGTPADVSYGWAAAARLAAGQQGTLDAATGGVVFREAGRDIDLGAQRAARLSRRIPNLYALVVSYRTFRNTCFLGNIVKEIILEGGNSPIRANLYRLQSSMVNYGAADTIWPGDVHVGPSPTVTAGGATAVDMAGTSHQAQQHPIVAPTLIGNMKLRDLRIIEEAERLSFENLVPSIREPYFSPLNLTKGDRGLSTYGVFVFDLEKYAIQNTQYGGLIKNRTSLLSCVGIEDIRIFRNVIEIDSSGNELTPGDLNVDTPTPEGFELVATLNSGVQMMDVGPLDQTNITVTFRDTTTYKYTKGTLEYKVEMVIRDKTRDALEDIRDQLVLTLDEVNTEITSANSAAQPDVATDAPAPGSLANNFGALTNQYLTAIHFIFGERAFHRFALGQWKKNLRALTIGANRDVEDRLLARDTIRDFISRLSAQLTTSQAASAGSFHVYSHISNRSNPGFRTEEHYFRNRQKIVNPPFVGLDYLGGSLAATAASVEAISYDEMATRVSSEATKYNVPNPDAQGVNKYGYLSPQRMWLGFVYPRSTQNFALNQNGGDFLPLLRNNALGTIQFDPLLESSVATNMSEIVASTGAHVKHLAKELREVLFEDDRKLPPPVPAQNNIGLIPSMTVDVVGPADVVSGSSDSILISTAGVDTTLFETQMVYELVNTQLTAYTPVLRIANPGSIQGSLALAKVNDDPAILDNSNSLSNMVNFESLVRIEYLHFFNPQIGVTAPQWRILSAQSFLTLQGLTTPRLCRLVSINQVLNTSVTLGLEPLSTVFILGSPTIINKTPNYEETLAQILSFVEDVNSNVDTSMDNNIAVYYSQNVVRLVEGTNY
jgi:hypothetical protein